MYCTLPGTATLQGTRSGTPTPKVLAYPIVEGDPLPPPAPEPVLFSPLFYFSVRFFRPVPADRPILLLRVKSRERHHVPFPKGVGDCRSRLSLPSPINRPPSSGGRFLFLFPCATVPRCPNPATRAPAATSTRAVSNPHPPTPPAKPPSQPLRQRVKTSPPRTLAPRPGRQNAWGEVGPKARPPHHSPSPRAPMQERAHRTSYPTRRAPPGIPMPMPAPGRKGTGRRLFRRNKGQAVRSSIPSAPPPESWATPPNRSQNRLNLQPSTISPRASRPPTPPPAPPTAPAGASPPPAPTRASRSREGGALKEVPEEPEPNTSPSTAGS